MRIQRKHCFTSVLLMFLTATSCLFTNCSSPKRFGSSNASAKGGTGLDGKPYLNFGTCPDGHVGKKSAVQISDDLSRAQLTRQDCADLAVPVPVDIDEVKFALNDSDVFRMNGKIFDREVSSGNQKITIAFSQSTGSGPVIQSLVWIFDGTPNALFGRVTEASGANTGVLNVQVPLGSLPTEYKTVPGQSSAFELTTTATSASLKYSIGGGTQVSIPNMDVAAQSSPVRPRTSLHFASGNDIASNGGAVGFTLADVNTLAQLNALPAGTKGMVWLGLCDGADANFISRVTPFIGHPNLFGFGLMSDPDPTGNWNPLCLASNLRAEADWIHANVPGALTYVNLMNLGTAANPSYANSYNPANTNIDLFGLSPYPCHSNLGGCDYGYITKAVNAAIASGVPRNTIVPIYQAAGNFANDAGGMTMQPTADQANQILATWGLLIPNPVFDHVYAWRTTPGVTTLEFSPSLQAVFSAHNRGQ